MEQIRIEHAPNGSLLTYMYITSADALVNNVFHLPLYEIWLDTEACRANEKSAKRILKNIVNFSIKTHLWL